MQTLDTNIFVKTTVSTKCSEHVHRMVENRYSHILLYSIRKEARPKLLRLNTFFTILADEGSEDMNPVNLLHSDRYAEYRSMFPQVSKALTNFFEADGIARHDGFTNYSDFMNHLLWEIRDILKVVDEKRCLFPKTEEEYENMLDSSSFHETVDKLDFMTNADKDKEHLALCKEYIAQSEKRLSFVTLGEDDFLDNKDSIENVIDRLVIETVPEFDPTSLSIE